MADPAQPMTDADTQPSSASTSFTPAAPLKTQGDQLGTDTKAAPATDQIKQGAQRLTEQAGDKARGFVDQGKERVGGALDQLTQMLNDAAAQVDEKLGEQYGQYARQAAGTVSGFADQVRAKEPDELVEDVRELIAKSPAVAVGATAAVAFVISRLLSSGLDQRGA